MKFREITLEDYEGVINCQVRNNLTSRSRKGWENWLSGHPYRDQLRDIPMGWVLENGSGNIVGANTNVPMGFEFNGKFIRVANASSWAVDEAYRNHSLKLGMAWMRQKNADLLIDMSAIESVAKLLKACKFIPLPINWYTQTIIWITHYPAFMAAVFKKKNWSIPAFLKYPAGLALMLVDRLRGKNRYRMAPNAAKNTDISVEEAAEFDAEFDELWAQLRLQPNRLLLIRDAQSLAWRHGGLVAQQRGVIVKIRDKGKIVGFTILWEFNREHLGLRGYQIADLQAINDEPAYITAAVNAAIGITRRKSFHLLEATGFHQHKRRELLKYNPHFLPSYTLPYYFKTADETLRCALTHADSWDPTISDGF